MGIHAFGTTNMCLVITYVLAHMYLTFLVDSRRIVSAGTKVPRSFAGRHWQMIEKSRNKVTASNDDAYMKSVAHGAHTSSYYSPVPGELSW